MKRQWLKKKSLLYVVLSTILAELYVLEFTCLVMIIYYHHIYFDIDKCHIKCLGFKCFSAFIKPIFLSSGHENVINLYYIGLCEWVCESEAGYLYSFITTIIATSGN